MAVGTKNLVTVLKKTEHRVGLRSTFVQEMPKWWDTHYGSESSKEQKFQGAEAKVPYNFCSRERKLQWANCT